MNAAGAEPFNVAVIGAGGFGRHYARILAQLNHRSPAGIPRIDRLIVSRTRLAQAADSAAMLWQKHHPAVADIIPAEVRDIVQLEALLQTHRPRLIAVVARDPELGDAIHADYTRHALRYGRVLCEKPFCPAGGNGESSGRLSQMLSPVTERRFGLNLPMAPVLEGLLSRRELVEAFCTETAMSFFWSAPVKAKTDLINDLVLHPWSLIPSFKRYRINRTEIRSDRADIELIIQRRNGSVSCRIHLREGPPFRGMQLGNRGWAFINRGFNVEIAALTCPLTDAAQSRDPTVFGAPVMEIVNPLEQNITALLRGRPVVNLRRTLHSQLFLEKLFEGIVPGQGGNR